MMVNYMTESFSNKYNTQIPQQEFEMVVESIPSSITFLAHNIQFQSVNFNECPISIEGTNLLDKKWTNRNIRNHLIHISNPVCKHRWGSYKKEKWNTFFLLPYKYIITNKVKECLFKIVHSFYPVKDIICRFLPNVLNQCSFCQCEGEGIEHVFVECPHSSRFWFKLQHYLSGKLGNQILLTKLQILLIFDDSRFTQNEIFVVNLFIILAKYYIHKMKWNEKEPSWTNFAETDLKIYLASIEPLKLNNKKLLKTTRLLKKYNIL